MRPLDLARRWHREGFVTDTGIRSLEARYAQSPDGSSTMTAVLLAGAGAVLAAAIIALPFLAEFDTEVVRVYLLVCAILVGGLAVALWHLIKWKEIAEALSITAAALLVPAGLMFMFDGPETELVAFIGAAIGAAAMALPARTAIVATAGAATMHILFASAFIDLWDDGGSIAWLLLTLVGVTVAFFTHRLPGWTDRHSLVNLAAPMLVGVASLIWWIEVAENHLNFAGSGELTVALIQAPILVAAFILRNRPVLIGSVAVVAVDAIVFGFDIGELYLGIPMLLLVAGGLVALALWARRDES